MSETSFFSAALRLTLSRPSKGKQNHIKMSLKDVSVCFRVLKSQLVSTGNYPPHFQHPHDAVHQCDPGVPAVSPPPSLHITSCQVPIFQTVLEKRKIFFSDIVFYIILNCMCHPVL